MDSSQQWRLFGFVIIIGSSSLFIIVQISKSNFPTPARNPTLGERNHPISSAYQKADVTNSLTMLPLPGVLPSPSDLTHPPGGQSKQTTLKSAPGQLERKSQVKSYCEEHYLWSPITEESLVKPQDFARIYVDDRHGILYCEVPKVACTNWKRILLVLTGKLNITDPDAIPEDLVHTTYQRKYLRRLDSYPPTDIAHKIAHYYKFMFARDPMERVVSAYMDKFNKPNAYYHKAVGRGIVSRFRMKPSAKSLNLGDDVTFDEFVRFLVDPKTAKPFDLHWRPFSELCLPCTMNYDFLGRYETFTDDAECILRDLNLSSRFQFPERTNKSPNKTRERTKHMYQNFTQMQMDNLFEIYATDYGMFPYDKV